MRIDTVAQRPAFAAPVREPQSSAPGLTAAPAAPAPPVPPVALAPEVTPPRLDDAIASANASMRSVATNLQFEKDSSSGKMVVRVIDTETQQILRQMPSEEMLAMSKALDRLQGLMVHLRV